ncbi:hypothetical protein [Thermosyntropha sp.]|uniref:hypothetical protein n=1 Tax=Thermosyntropha sp. TaxID=2740820 RepID=UPI0025EE88C8|nr:hypothetical protein [Thermosyntropha sp.]MBO8158853.1 hypothetical protein [Thermosyntropha sp.]
MQIIRQFSVRVTDPELDIFNPEWTYEVLGVDVDEDGVTWLLLISENKDLVWVETTKCKVASLHDRF